MYKFEAKVWVYPGEAAWYFVNLPAQLSKELRHEYADFIAGFGSLPIEVCTGQTTWQTSIFYDSKKSCYMLPLKASVRKAERINAGKKIKFELRIRI